MGVFTRPDSPVYWLYLETTKAKEKTAIRIGTTVAQQKDSAKLAEDRYHQRMNELAARLYQLPTAVPAIRVATYAATYRTDTIAHDGGRRAETPRGRRRPGPGDPDSRPRHARAPRRSPRSPAPRSARAVAVHRRPESGGGVRGAALAAGAGRARRDCRGRAVLFCEVSESGESARLAGLRAAAARVSLSEGPSQVRT